MAKGVNKVILIGNLTRDPEVRYLNNGAAVCNFTVATAEEWKDKVNGQKQEKSEFHNIQAFGKLGEICSQYLRKGAKVYVSGSLASNTVDKNGDKKTYWSIRISEMQMLGGKKESSGPPPDNIGNQKQPDDFDGFDDDIPF